MRRFLPSRELARDLRFKRASSKNELFRTLPDDVAGIVRVLELVGPKLRERVAGTALEAVFDDLGPGFLFLTTAAGTAQSTDRTPLQLRAQLHGIFVGELQALEAASRTLWDFPDAPWDFKMNMARQCWDEARHVQIYEKLIAHVGDPILEQAVDFVLADELTHVRFGSDWVKELTRDDPDRARRAAEFQRETD